MKSLYIEDIIGRYGTARILEDHNLTVADVIEILDELRYIDLEMYLDEGQEVLSGRHYDEH